MNRKDLIVSYAVQSVSYELYTPFKPGLVDKNNCGAHSDMNYFTFIDSISVISRYFDRFYNFGQSASELDSKSFKGLRDIGIMCENDMLTMTGGINTHKGTIFCFAILLCVIGHIESIKTKPSEKVISYYVRSLCDGICIEDLAYLGQKKELTHGEKVYLKYGISGIRGEVENGFPTVMNYALPYLQNMMENYSRYGVSHLGEADSQHELLSKIYLNTLLCLMKYTDDTTILHRHDLEVLNRVKSDSNQALMLGGAFLDSGYKYIKILDEEYSKLRISPGGSADLLSVTIMIYKYLSIEV